MLSELHQIRTKDGLLLEGLFFKPKKKGKAAAFWLSGLTGRFSERPKRIHALADVLNRRSIAFATFEHRGSGVISSFTSQRRGRTGSITGGTTFEKFEHSVFDIDAVIRFLKRRGYTKIFLLGHSTGANKSAYYIWKQNSRGLSGVGLLGAVSDIAPMRKELGKTYKHAVKEAERMVRRGKGEELLPMSLTNTSFWSADRLLSITKEGRKEDTFPFYDSKRHFYWARRVRTPVLVLIGSREQHAHQPIPRVMDIFRREIPKRWFTGIILKNAKHSFTGKEKELASMIVRWIQKNAQV